MGDTAVDIQEVLDRIEPVVEAGEYDFKKCATRLDRNGPYHMDDVVAAILATEGTLGLAARLLGRQRLRLKDYIYRNPEILEFFEDYFEGNIDIIERNYIREAKSGDMAASKHILSTKGRNRGYGTQAVGISVDPTIVPFNGFTLTVVPAENPFDKEGAEEDA